MLKFYKCCITFLLFAHVGNTSINCHVCMLRNDNKIVGILQKKQCLLVNILCIVMTIWRPFGVTPQA